MKRLPAVCGGLLAALLLFAVGVHAKEVETAYFTLDLPPDWEVENHMHATGDNDLCIAFMRQNKEEMLVIVITDSQSPYEACMNSRRNFEMRSVKFGELAWLGNSYMTEFTYGDIKGRQFCTTNGKLTSVVTVVGGGSRELLQKHLKRADPKLFPTVLE